MFLCCSYVSTSGVDVDTKLVLRGIDRWGEKYVALEHGVSMPTRENALFACMTSKGSSHVTGMERQTGSGGVIDQ